MKDSWNTSAVAQSADAARILLRQDGYYWVSTDDDVPNGPFESQALALVDMRANDDDTFTKDDMAVGYEPEAHAADWSETEPWERDQDSFSLHVDGD